MAVNDNVNWVVIIKYILKLQWSSNVKMYQDLTTSIIYL